jgi:predicted aspartyl protease
MRKATILSTMLAMSASVAAAETIDNLNVSEPTAATAIAVPTVLIEANEPKYVAPTLRDRIGRIWAPVMINGKGPFRLVLDTGANSSVVIPSVAQSLGIPVHESNHVQLHGVTGSAVVPTISVDSIEVGDLLIDGARLPVVADVFGGAEGVLGPKGLGDKRIFIDFANDQINIAKSRGQPTPLGYTRVPLTMTRGQLPMFDIRIGNIRTKAILDTGAQLTIGNLKLKEALLRRAKEGVDQDIIGVTLDIARGKSVSIPTIALGTIEIRNMRVVFGDMFIFDKWDMNDKPAMLIGMDVIGSLDKLVIDYKQRELHLRARR